MSLAQRSFRSVSWTTTANFISLPVNFIQSVILARNLPVEYFGIFAGVVSIINFSDTFIEMGLTSAFLHRSTETEDDKKACTALFTLRLFFQTIWAICLFILGVLLFSDLYRTVFLIMVLSTYLLRVALAPRTLLVRRVEHQRLALIDLSIGLCSAAVSILIAVTFKSIWALLISSWITLIITIAGLYIWKPFWKPGLIWDLKIFKYFINFGARNQVNNLLDSGLDNLDNLWIGYYLGDMFLGYYSRAFKFASYPRLFLSSPVNSVIVGTYAELKYDRYRLSMAFFRANAFLVRAGFLVAGWLAVIAPYFISLILGERWLPMLQAFRLMLIFAMLDPIKVSISNVLIAVGKPEKITIARLAQAIVLVIGLFSLGPRLQIAGVAISVDLMIIVGTVILLIYTRDHVDVSYWKLFAVPVISIIVGLGFAHLVNYFPEPYISDWVMGGAKTVMFLVGYLGVLIAFERQELFVTLKESLNYSNSGRKNPFITRK